MVDRKRSLDTIRWEMEKLELRQEMIEKEDENQEEFVSDNLVLNTNALSS